MHRTKSLVLITYVSISAPMDYFTVPGRTLTFPIGSAQGSSECTNINIVDDNFLEADLESFFADLSADPNVAEVDSARSRAAITIVDNNMGKRLIKCTPKFKYNSLTLFII